MFPTFKKKLITCVLSDVSGTSNPFWNGAAEESTALSQVHEVQVLTDVFSQPHTLPHCGHVGALIVSSGKRGSLGPSASNWGPDGVRAGRAQDEDGKSNIGEKRASFRNI